jgi:hypothetical protein
MKEKVLSLLGQESLVAVIRLTCVVQSLVRFSKIIIG